MSIWGIHPVENDDAADWIGEFLEEPSILTLNDAFDDVLGADEEDYLEITECANAVAASAIVAELFGQGAGTRILDEDELATLSLMAQKLTRGARISLVAQAIQSTERVAQDLDQSELLQLMNESASMRLPWFKQMNGLLKRLQRAEKHLQAST